MITEIFLSKQEVEELSIHILGRKAKEAVVNVCISKSICGRSTAYNALDVNKYDGDNYNHRRVTAEAVKYLKENFNTTFSWAEVELPIEA